MSGARGIAARAGAAEAEMEAALTLVVMRAGDDWVLASAGGDETPTFCRLDQDAVVELCADLRAIAAKFIARRAGGSRA